MKTPRLTEVFLLEAQFKRVEGLDDVDLLGGAATLHQVKERIRAGQDIIDKAFSANHGGKRDFVQKAKERIQFYISAEESREGWQALHGLQPGSANNLIKKLKELKQVFSTLDGANVKACTDAKFALDLVLSMIVVTINKVLDLYKEEIEADGMKLEPYEKTAADLWKFLQKDAEQDPEIPTQDLGSDPKMEKLMALFDRVKSMIDKDKEHKN